MLTMMEYGTSSSAANNGQSKYASSIMSSETLSESCGSRNNRIRTIRLVRPTHGPSLPAHGLNYRHGSSLGFSIRGGREHETGIFVSSVEPGSEAHIRGLRVGDQIIRINGFTVDDAVHKEVIQLISNHTHLILKVRSVGMIPVKDRKTDSLSWQIITDSGSPARISPQLTDKFINNNVRINIAVAPKCKLGCGICKGPEWKPGIFVQFTKEGGIAREAGLRPGDQILYCNNVDFSDIPFNEAVCIMKSSRQLNLIVRKGAGSELFPGESSGYNSSASSVTGDQSPSWSDSKRLSIVKEENLDLSERLTHLDKFKHLVNANKWDTWEDEPEEKPLFKPTIINLTENGTTIHNNGSDEAIIREYNNCEDIYMKKEQKMVVVDVHRCDHLLAEKMENDDCNDKLLLKKSLSASSISSYTSKSSCTTNTSLSSAITLEIQRRQMQQKQELPHQNSSCSIDEQIQKKKILKNVDSDRQFQHNKLMDEFKKVHKKMFKSNENETDSSNNGTQLIIEDRLNNNNNNNKSSEIEKLSSPPVAKLNKLNRAISGPAPPPPPPPLPQLNGNSSSSQQSSPSASVTQQNSKNTVNKPKPPTVPVKYSVLSYNNNNNNRAKSPSISSSSSSATTFNEYHPTPQNSPPCPSPDYDSLSLASSTTSTRSSAILSFKRNDSAEMESLDSYQINNPSNVTPKPPSTYFKKRTLTNSLSNQSDTTTRTRPVSITIGEYPSMRRQPGKLNFLRSMNDQFDGTEKKSSTIGNQLTNELIQTLNRSNLRKKTESMEDLLSANYSLARIKTQRNGSVQISLNKSNLAKSTNDLTDDASADDNYDTIQRKNRVTINVNSNLQIVENNSSPSGILKNGHECNHKIISAQKSITFGEMPTLTKPKMSFKT